MTEERLQEILSETWRRDCSADDAHDEIWCEAFDNETIPITGDDKKLIEFAKRTLATLQNTEEWSSDTTDEIDTHAADLGLRAIDGEGRFVATVNLA